MRSFWRRSICVCFVMVSVGVSHSKTWAACAADELPPLDTVRSLEDVFDAVARRGSGEIIRADLMAQGIGDVCLWVYEVKLLSQTGDVTNVVYDASALRMIGFSSPEGAPRKKPKGVLGIGQRFGFFGRRDPSSEGRGDSNRGDDSGQNDGSVASADNDNSNATDNDTAATSDASDNAADSDSDSSDDKGDDARGDDRRSGGDKGSDDGSSSGTTGGTGSNNGGSGNGSSESGSSSSSSSGG